MFVLEKYTNHTGGAYGVDTFGCLAGIFYGFNNHNHYRDSNNTKLSASLKQRGIEATVLSKEQMDFARSEIKTLLNKTYPNNVMGNLQVRNYYQVKNADRIFCFSRKISDTEISGGTNTAFQLSIKLKKELFFYDVLEHQWYEYERSINKLVKCQDLLRLTENYAIVGTRNVQSYNIKSKTTGEWIETPDYLGDCVSEQTYDTIKELFKNTIRYEIIQITKGKENAKCNN